MDIKIQYRVKNRPPLDPTFGRFNKLHIPMSPAHVILLDT
jgi:hypothetical protein